ncbi:MAG: hypothetical protein IPK18_13600 [Sphingobacteriales bacterium]|nr:MAG: hypothetical protein IPK18_13600 [Sphingobacteriales bacterium]
MKKVQKTAKIIIFIFCLSFIYTSCKKENNTEIIKSLEDFHVKKIDKELSNLSKVFSEIFKNNRNVNILKKAIYQKKKDENITIKDFYIFYDKYSPKVQYTNNRTGFFYDSFEEMLYDKYNNISSISLDDFRELINTYDMAIYWEYIEKWNESTQPIVGYPLTEEEEVGNAYDLLTYKVYNNIKEEIVNRAYIKNNPVILIRPNEDFENSSPNYYSNIPYIWLKDLLKDSALVNSNQRTEKVQDVFDRFRIETINTNGNVFDGNGGPEFKFFRNSPTSYTTGFYGFATILTLNLSASAAGSTNEIIVGNYINNILHDNWHIIDFRSLIGTYEQDGGVIKNQQVSGIGIKADVLGIPILNISFSSTITRKDDLIDKYEMYRSSFVNNVQLRQNWGWGFRTINYNGTHILPIRRTNHTDLTITYRNY